MSMKEITKETLAKLEDEIKGKSISPDKVTDWVLAECLKINDIALTDIERAHKEFNFVIGTALTTLGAPRAGLGLVTVGAMIHMRIHKNRGGNGNG